MIKTQRENTQQDTTHHKNTHLLLLYLQNSLLHSPTKLQARHTAPCMHKTIHADHQMRTNMHKVPTPHAHNKKCTPSKDTEWCMTTLLLSKNTLLKYKAVWIQVIYPIDWPPCKMRSALTCTCPAILWVKMYTTESTPEMVEVVDMHFAEAQLQGVNTSCTCDLSNTNDYIAVKLLILYIYCRERIAL